MDVEDAAFQVRRVLLGVFTRPHVRHPVLPVRVHVTQFQVRLQFRRHFVRPAGMVPLVVLDPSAAMQSLRMDAVASGIDVDAKVPVPFV